MLILLSRTSSLDIQAVTESREGNEDGEEDYLDATEEIDLLALEVNEVEGIDSMVLVGYATMIYSQEWIKQ